MLEKFLSHVWDPDEDKDRFVRLDSVEFNEGDGILQLSTKDTFSPDVWDRWKVTAKSLHDYRIVKPWGDFRFHLADHILARHCTEPRQDLYFRGVAPSPLETIGRLYIAHRDAVEGWIPFESYFGSGRHIEHLLKSGHGLLTRGPVFLIQKYSSVLLNDGLKPNTLPPTPAKWWNGQQHVEYTHPLAVIILGKSYFIADRFEEEQLFETPG